MFYKKCSKIKYKHRLKIQNSIKLDLIENEVELI